MKKVAPISQRKSDHIRINLEQDVRSGISSGLERVTLIHEALPEINLADVDTSQVLFGKLINAPILISSMTGGTLEARELNRRLAEAANEFGIVMGVGSQRAALEDPTLDESFKIIRRVAPNILLFANLGAIQFNHGFSLNHCISAIEMIQADALILHLNPLQEALQVDGDTSFTGLAGKIEIICKNVPVPVIVKEVGWGISERTAKILAECGVMVIDVAGAGGTSWSQVEMHRAPNEHLQKLCASFINWGIPTVDSIRNVRNSAPGIRIFASGGIQDGIDIVKSIALGASLGGVAGSLLRAAALSQDHLRERLRLIKHQIEIAMFCNGKRTIADLINTIN
jgi:isopentenyl-diphosphate Delta-isomerase